MAVMMGAWSVLANILSIEWLDIFLGNGDYVWAATVVSGIVGGVAGGAIGYSLTQGLSHRPILLQGLLKYALIGTFLWPFIGILSLTIVVVYYCGPLSFLSHSIRSEILSYIEMLVIFVIFPGGVLGIVLALWRRYNSYRWKNIPVVLGVVASLLVVCVFVWLGVTKPTLMGVISRALGSPCVTVFEDRNRDGRLDPGDKWLDDLPGAIVVVEDPNGINGGRFALAVCGIAPRAQPRTIHVTVILPAGYTATTPLELDVRVLGIPGFHNYPPRVYIGVQELSAP